MKPGVWIEAVQAGQHAAREWARQHVEGFHDGGNVFEGLMQVLRDRCDDEEHAQRAHAYMLPQEIAKTVEGVEDQVNKAVESTRQ